MANPTDLTDVTPAPVPTPKKQFTFTAQVPGAAGQTFQQAMAAAFPPGARQRVNGSDFVINIELNIAEL